MSIEWTRNVADELKAAAEQQRFSGVVLVHHEDEPVLELASGFANRADERPITIQTHLATASGTKGFTALAVVSMIEEGLLGFDTPLHEAVGTDLPTVDKAVTIARLLGHTSGVGDYLDEEKIEDIDDYVLDVPVQQLLGPEDFVPILTRYPQADPPGTRWAYNNGGFMWLALVIERVGKHSYHDEVQHRVFEPADLTKTGFFRSDQLPPETALGYLADGRTNVFHLPVIGTGDGGAYTTGPDMIRFWRAFLAGEIVGSPLVAEITKPAHDAPPNIYGLGFWIGPDYKTVQLVGMDAGVSLWSGANPNTGFRYCFIANNSSDVWPLASIVDDHLAKSV